MRRIATAIAATALIATASCGDNPSPGATAPTASNSSAMRAFGELSAAGHAPFTYSFNISSRGGSYLLGEYLLTVPANAVCDPSTSNYGPQSWDSPCTPFRGSVPVRATVSSFGGRDYIDFTPHIRFVPSDDRSSWVTISAYRLGAIGGQGDLRRFSILFADMPGGPLVDESAGDPTLATHVNIVTGFVWRRVKHFTGYNIYLGMITNCTPYVDDGCYPVGTVVSP
jgi:hypothetical protein